MLLGEPAKTQFDLNFSLFRFPIRISAWFWLAALVLGNGAGPKFIFGWIAAMLISILIHELGHAIAFRYYGVESQIVLYHFGGLAIPYSDRWGGRTAAERNPWNDIIISAAGPGVQILAALALIAAIRLSGYVAPAPFRFLAGGGAPIESLAVIAFASPFIYISIFWALLNLAPLYPLDGGQIARNLFLLFGGQRAIQHSLMLSVGSGGLLAFYFMSIGQPFIAMMFGFLAYSSFQALQSYGGGYGRG